MLVDVLAHAYSVMNSLYEDKKALAFYKIKIAENIKKELDIKEELNSIAESRDEKASKGPCEAAKERKRIAKKNEKKWKLTALVLSNIKQKQEKLLNKEISDRVDIELRNNESSDENLSEKVRMLFEQNIFKPKVLSQRVCNVLSLRETRKQSIYRCFLSLRKKQCNRT